MISIITPAYNETKMIALTERTISGILEQAQIPYELVFVDDGSRDDTWAQIRQAADRNPHVFGIHLSRNFGKEAAMFAGLEQAHGDCCVVLDCDLQHPPEKIVEMYRLWEQGYEVVEGIKEDRGEENRIYGTAAAAFYQVMSKITGMNMADASDFKLLDRKVVDTLNQMPERKVFFRALSYWVGFRKTEVSYRVQKRVAGESKWSTASLIRYALTNIISFSTAPLQLVTLFGVFTLLMSVILGSISLYQKFAGIALTGFTTVILIQLLTSSMIMISLGIIGLYIARIYEECKGRPKYIISETYGEHTDDPKTSG